MTFFDIIGQRLIARCYEQYLAALSIHVITTAQLCPTQMAY